MFDFWTRAVSALFIVAAGIYFYKKRNRRYLQFFQQEEYESKRFVAWYFAKRAYDTRATKAALGGLIASGIACYFNSEIGMCAASVVFSLWLIAIAKAEENPETTGKIKLKMTPRATRIYKLAFGIFAFVFLLCASLCALLEQNAIPALWLLQLVLIHKNPGFLVIANQLLKPYESSVQKGFADQAKGLIRKYDPIVIGITGSYGKTSSKYILKDVLDAVRPTFSTPGSINSYMGVTREIRERLKPEHQYAVIEMGAYYRGSIKKMCSLTPPKAGIITAVGLMHLERFGGPEQVFLAKSELAQAIPQDGILVVNGDYDYCRRMAAENPKQTTLVYGLEPEKGHLDAYLYDIKADEKGSTFKIRWQDNEYEGFAQLYGKPMLSNVLGSFTLACALGISPSLVLAAIRNVRTASNRLEPVRASISSLSAEANGQCPPGTILRLNDAYNSNPTGFASALEVLGDMPGGRKVLVTPGMIELGDRQEAENKEAALKAAKVCDLVLVVGETNRQALVAGLQEGNLSAERYKEIPSMKEALAYLATSYCQDGDIVLIENDLPDLYETVISF
ncbi:MAG: UDP-N-acetylmuramoyl-tripeptide--D-alanyl-D-alanine ligase [Candidatus Obscuribacterales bacterium]|nr:UDP-N-acetylmuramoyl-tripeptide--D-alanyl-D-alanine ligase [Candidatus Obscuribacterales bacterium]